MIGGFPHRHEDSFFHHALDRQPRRRILLADGTHLSLEGQRVVGETLFPCLKKAVENQAWLPKNSPLPELPETH